MQLIMVDRWKTIAWTIHSMLHSMLQIIIESYGFVFYSSPTSIGHLRYMAQPQIVRILCSLK